MYTYVYASLLKSASFSIRSSTQMLANLNFIVLLSLNRKSKFFISLYFLKQGNNQKPNVLPYLKSHQGINDNYVSFQKNIQKKEKNDKILCNFLRNVQMQTSVIFQTFDENIYFVKEKKRKNSFCL